MKTTAPADAIQNVLLAAAEEAVNAPVAERPVVRCYLAGPALDPKRSAPHAAEVSTYATHAGGVRVSVLDRRNRLTWLTFANVGAVEDFEDALRAARHSLQYP